MRPLLRDLIHRLGEARSDLLVVWLALVAFMIGGCRTRGETTAESKARAALVLAKVKRERESMGCHVDLATAQAESRRRRRPLVLWVNLACSQHPELRRQLNEAVHCHVPSRDNDRSPRLLIRGEDGTEWFVPPEKIGPDTAQRIRAKWQAESIKKSVNPRGVTRPVLFSLQQSQ